MERLTIKNWRNLDPWETCGQDNYCKRGCHEQGGCTKGCIVPRIYARLAAYEETGLEPEEIERIVDAYGRGHTLRTESAERLEIVREIKTDRLRELAKAEKDGRLEVLPCKVGDHILADGREAIVVWFFGYKTGRYLHAQFLDNAECADIPFYEIGKNRLSAREDAEAAMAKKGDSEQ